MKMFKAVAMIIVLLELLTSSTSINSAEDYFEQGNTLIEAGKLLESVIFYRAAVRLKPESCSYQYKLGEIEYLLNHHEKSKQRFRKIVQMGKANFLNAYLNESVGSTILNVLAEINNDGITDCDRNCNLTNNDATCSRTNSRLLKKIHTLDCTLVEECDSLDIINITEPFVLRHAHHKFQWNISKLKLKELLNTFGNESVEFYPQNMVTKPEKVYKVPFKEAADYLDYPEGAFVTVDTSLPGTYIQWNLDRSTWLDIAKIGNLSLPIVLEDKIKDFVLFWMYNVNDNQIHDSFHEKITELTEDIVSGHINYFSVTTHWNMILVGEKESGMFMHQDILPVGSWQVLIEGEKLWHLCPPSETPYMYKAGDIDAFNPDFIKFPDFLKASCSEITIFPGDLLYYPKGYWHQTVNLATPSVAISGSVELDDNHLALHNVMNDDCSLKNIKLGLSETFCNAKFKN